jgi:hypothetical protein
VRVVDEDRERLALVDGLEAPGNALGVLEAAGDPGVVDAELACDDHGAQRVEDVEAAGQRRAQPAPVDGERRAGRVAFQIGRADLRVV